MVVGLQDTVGPGLQGVANVDHNAAGDVRAWVPALHLQAFTKAGSCLKPLNPDGRLAMQTRWYVTGLLPYMQGSAPVLRAAQPCRQKPLVQRLHAMSMAQAALNPNSHEHCLVPCSTAGRARRDTF